MSSSHLPSAIVAAATALASELGTWAAAHPESTLADLETAVLSAVRAALPALLHGTLLASLRALATDAPSPRCPSCQHRADPHDWRYRRVRTLCGVLRWERPWAECARCAQGFGVGDATLGVAPYQRRSAGLTALLVALGSEQAFAQAAQTLRQTTGLQVSAETVRTVTEATGTTLADAADASVAAAEKDEPAVVVAAPGQLVVETDGVMVRYRDTGWHEVKIGLVGGWTQDQRGRCGLQQVSYVAAREEAHAFARRLGVLGAQRGALTVVGTRGAHGGVLVLRPVVVLGDGAHWIWELAAAQFGERTEIVDYYHACEHLTTVAAARHGVGTAAATAWAAQQRAVLLAQGAAGVLPALVTPPGASAATAETLRVERGYFRTNQARMAYPTFQQAGLPIGSGAVEGSAKHVIQQRLKRAGARWSAAGGRALIALRAQQASQIGVAA